MGSLDSRGSSILVVAGWHENLEAETRLTVYSHSRLTPVPGASLLVRAKISSR